jgi:hypothetical protein
MRSVLALLFVFPSALLLAQVPPATDSVVVVASGKYGDPPVLKRFLLGKNYREVWRTPVKLPVFHIKDYGFRIIELGGGQQTKSLKLEDKKGREWALRTIDKDVDGALPPFLRNTLAEKVTQDMVSAAHPYAPLAIPVLAQAIGVVVPVPRFFFVPDDPAFGEHRALFANTVCMLEEREPTPDGSETKSTNSMLEDMIEENDQSINQKAVLKARLLDMLIADWDRHADQWRWGSVDSGRVEHYYAIPRDRDQAFFASNGILVKMARKLGLKHFVGYRAEMAKTKNLNYKSWKFDRFFLNELAAADWEQAIREVQGQLTDQVVDQAFRQLPKEVYAMSAPDLSAKFKSRRDDLLRAGMGYYEYLTKTVTITGSDKAEIFSFRPENNGITIEVWDENDGKKGRALYKRWFTPDETKMITLTALGGNDQFLFSSQEKTGIKLRLLGGEGKDVYDINGLKAKIIDNQ